jgi:hypothetical protein
MRKDKEAIFKLRQEGKSFRHIQQKTGVSRGTLVAWFKNIGWSKHVTSTNTKKKHDNAKDQIARINIVRKLNLQYFYALKESEAQKDFHNHKKDPLFWAGIMAYASAGDRSSKHGIRLSSADPYLHRVFGQFSETYLGVPKDQHRYGLHMHEISDGKACKEYWSRELGTPEDNFYKTQVIKGKTPSTRLQYGICMTIISNTGLKKKLLKWLQLIRQETFT